MLWEQPFFVKRAIANDMVSLGERVIRRELLPKVVRKNGQGDPERGSNVR